MTRDWKLIDVPYHRLDEAADVLARAFAEDPIVARFVPTDTPERGRAMRQLFKTSCLARLSARQPLLGAEWDNKIVGVAIVNSPYQPAESESMKRAWAQVEETIGADNMKRADAFVALRDKHRPPRQHHYLLALGVDPTYQNMGFGSALMNSVVELAQNDNTSTGVMLETEGSKSIFYEHAGFSTIGTEDVDGVDVRYMYRGVR